MTIIETPEPPFRVLVLCSDTQGCFYRRILQPFYELRRFNIEMDYTPILPSEPDKPGPSLNALVKLIKGYNLVVAQRIVSLELTRMIKSACFLAGVSVCHEVDDDYLGLEPGNPCYYGVSVHSELLDRARECQLNGRMEELEELMPILEKNRIQGLAEYKEALRLFDAILVTTNELKEALAPYNRNIYVLPNQVDRIYRNMLDHNLEQSDSQGKMQLYNKFGMYTVPSFYLERDSQTFEPVMRNGDVECRTISKFGYSGTLSHRADFETIGEGYDRLVEKWANKVHFVYLGDPYFYRRQRSWTGTKTPDNPEGDGRPNRRIHIPESDPAMYHLNLRNLTFGLAPLTFCKFNAAKSELKALEYAMWGICPILPRFITYTRAFTENVNCVMYSNSDEFYKVSDYLLQNPIVGKELGKNAMGYVGAYRLEKHHAPRRAQILKEIASLNQPLRVLTPNRKKDESSK